MKAAQPDLYEVNEVAAAIAEVSAARLIADASATQKKVVRSLVARALEQGWSDAVLQSRIAGAAGLDERYAQAVENYRDNLVRTGTPPGRAKRQTERYAKRLRKYRANVIGQHETRSALLAAQRMIWFQQQQDGDLSPYAVRIWRTHKDERTCPSCGPLNGQRASLKTGAAFRGGLTPPLHVNCRCHEELLDEGILKTDPALVYKHLPGLHDQKTHGRKKMRSAACWSFVQDRADWGTPLEREFCQGLLDMRDRYPEVARNIVAFKIDPNLQDTDGNTLTARVDVVPQGFIISMNPDDLEVAQQAAEVDRMSTRGGSDKDYQVQTPPDEQMYYAHARATAIHEFGHVAHFHAIALHLKEIADRSDETVAVGDILTLFSEVTHDHRQGEAEPYEGWQVDRLLAPSLVTEYAERNDLEGAAEYFTAWSLGVYGVTLVPHWMTRMHRRLDLDPDGVVKAVMFSHGDKFGPGSLVWEIAHGRVPISKNEPKDGDGDGFVDDGKPTMRPALPKVKAKKQDLSQMAPMDALAHLAADDENPHTQRFAAAFLAKCEEYPMVSEHMHSVTVMGEEEDLDDPDEPVALIYVSDEEAGYMLILNDLKLAQGYDDRLNDPNYSVGGQNPDAYVEAVAIHEFGHMAQRHALMVESLTKGDELYDDYEAEDVQGLAAHVTVEVSEYAGVNFHEAAAEYFAAAHFHLHDADISGWEKWLKTQMVWNDEEEMRLAKAARKGCTFHKPSIADEVAKKRTESSKVKKHGDKGTPGYQFLHPGIHFRQTNPKTQKRLERYGKLLQAKDHAGAQELLDRDLTLDDHLRAEVEIEITRAWYLAQAVNPAAPAPAGPARAKYALRNPVPDQRTPVLTIVKDVALNHPDVRIRAFAAGILEMDAKYPEVGNNIKYFVVDPPFRIGDKTPPPVASVVATPKGWQITCHSTEMQEQADLATERKGLSYPNAQGFHPEMILDRDNDPDHEAFARAVAFHEFGHLAHYHAAYHHFQADAEWDGGPYPTDYLRASMDILSERLEYEGSIIMGDDEDTDEIVSRVEVSDYHKSAWTKFLNSAPVSSYAAKNWWEAAGERFAGIELGMNVDVYDPDYYDLLKIPLNFNAEGVYKAMTEMLRSDCYFGDGSIPYRYVQEASVEKAGRLDWSPKKNWVDGVGGLPTYIEDIALALIRDHGMARERAIPVAINRVKMWARGGDDVKADTRAKAAKAVAEWEAKKAKNAAKKG